MSNLELRGELGLLRQKNMALDIKAGGLVKGIRHIFAVACYTSDIEDVDVEEAASLVAELIEVKGDKIRNLGTIKRIEKELA